MILRPYEGKWQAQVRLSVRPITEGITSAPFRGTDRRIHRDHECQANESPVMSSVEPPWLGGGETTSVGGPDRGIQRAWCKG